MIWAAAILLLAAGAIWLAWVLSERLRKPLQRGPAQRATGARFADLPQGTTHYRWEGHVDGPVAVCIHGLTSASYVWGEVGARLSMMGFRVLLYDLYGRGLSERADGPQDGAFFVRQLKDLLDDQKIDEPVTLLGYSMGGAVAASFAAAEPGRVDRLVLLAATGLGYSPGRFDGFCRRVPGLGDWLMRVFGGLVLRRRIRRAARVPPVVAGIIEAQMAETRTRGFLEAVLSSGRNLLAEDLEAAHRRIAGAGIPVLAIWGGRDDVIPPTAPGRLAQLNRAARQETVADAGHGLPYTHPDAVHRALQEFLRDV